MYINGLQISLQIIYVFIYYLSIYYCVFIYYYVYLYIIYLLYYLLFTLYSCYLKFEATRLHRIESYKNMCIVVYNRYHTSSALCPQVAF